MAGVTAAGAQTVSVTNGMGEKGFGWMFDHAGSCYAVMPRHVAGPFPKVTVTSAAPVANGQGTVIRPFWEGVDLALAVIRGGIEERCTETLDRLQPSRRARGAVEAQLHRLSPTGEEERIPLRITARDYLTLTGEVAGAGAEIYQGTSGAFAFAGIEPVGMAIQSDDPERAVFMRVEEIALNLGRFLQEQGTAFAQESRSEVVPAEAGGIPLRLVSASAPPVAPQFGPENTLGEGLYVFAPQRLTELLYKVDGDQAVAMSQVRLSAPMKGGYALPRRVLVMTSANPDQGRFLQWTGGEVAADGLYDTGPMGQRNVLWLKIRILDARSDGPLAVAEVSAR